MTPQEKDLLLRDLCCRLPYGVVGWAGRREILANISDKGFYKPTNRDGWHPIEEFKPYLRPMSDMTAEEISEFNSIYGDANSTQSDTDVATKIIDFYNERFFDFRGLIPMGLALPATKDMYNINKQ